MDRLDALSFFVRVVEKRGVAAAGRDFGMSPATASDRLAALEAHYGATLLHRTTRSISLTDQGRVLYERARGLLEEANDLEAQIKLGVERLSGRIRVSAPCDLGERRITPLVDTFLEQHPETSIELMLTDGYVDLASEGLDLAIRFGALSNSSLMARKIGDNRRVICAAPSYLEQHGRPEHPDELAAHNCLVMQFGPVIDREWSFVIDGKRHDVLVTGNRTANTGAQVRRWCLDGRGIALKSIWDVGQDLKQGRLVELLKSFEPQSHSALQIVFNRGSGDIRRVRAFIDLLAESLKNASE